MKNLVDICPVLLSRLGNMLIVNFLVRSVYLTGLCLLAALFLVSYAGAASEEALTAPALEPVYRISLRVHLGNSSRTPEEFAPVFSEINKT